MPPLDYQDDQVQDSVKVRAKIKLERDLGPVIMGALADPKTVEIMLNADGKLWQERLGEKMQQIGTLPASRSESIIKTLAGFHDKEITKGRPLLECELPIDDSRFAGQFPPIVPAPTFAIGKKAIAIFTLAQYVAADIMTPAQLVVIEAAIVSLVLVNKIPPLIGSIAQGGGTQALGGRFGAGSVIAAAKLASQDSSSSADLVSRMGGIANGAFVSGASSNASSTSTISPLAAAMGVTAVDVASSGCYAYDLAAWRIREHLSKDTGDLWARSANYHSRTIYYNTLYRADLRVKADQWAHWLAKFMPSIYATITTYTIKPNVIQASTATHKAQDVRKEYVPRTILVSSQ
jgi:hypothetical protein